MSSALDPDATKQFVVRAGHLAACDFDYTPQVQQLTSADLPNVADLSHAADMIAALHRGAETQLSKP